MNTENENQIREIEKEDKLIEAENNLVNNDVGDEEFISEFAPAPIKIPNYNKEKELAKIERQNAKRKKKKSKKSKKRRKLLRKIVFMIRTAVLFVLMLSVMAVTLSTLLVKLNTTEYSIENAIRTHESERFIVGKIKNPAKLNLKHSSNYASVADVLRDNSMITVTYDDIEQAVRKSSFNEFIANTSYRVIRTYIYGDAFKAITPKDISNLMLDNVAYIKLVTGIELGESACNDFGRYISKSAAFKELSTQSLEKQTAAKYTYITKVLFSTPALIVMVIALMLLMVLTVIGCSGFAHRMIGITAMLSGIIVGVGGFLFKPVYTTQSTFVECVIDAITKSFNINAIIYGSIVFAVGLLVILLGHLMADDEYEEYEEDYIEDMEKSSL